MTVIVGRTHRLAQWNAFDWARSYRYLSAWAHGVAPTTAGKQTTLQTVTQPVGANASLEQHRIVFGLRSGQGYECSTRWLSGTVTSIVLLDLLPSTTYYAVRLWKYANGEIVCGPEFSFTTAAYP